MTILEAASINAGACEFCGDVHVNMFDADGEIFATASVPLDCLWPLIEQMRAAAAVVTARP